MTIAIAKDIDARLVHQAMVRRHRDGVTQAPSKRLRKWVPSTSNRRALPKTAITSTFSESDEDDIRRASVRANSASVAPAVSVVFVANSAEISDRAKADLDRVARTISEQRMSQVELRAFAGGDDPADARKVALVRALAVRSYLIDQGVTARIEVGTFAPTRNGKGGERVDVLAPGP